MKKRFKLSAAVMASTLLISTAAFAQPLDTENADTMEAINTIDTAEAIDTIDVENIENVTEDVAEADLGITYATFSSYDIHFDCVLDGWPRKDYAVFNIYSKDNTLLASHTEYISSPNGFSVHFDLPELPVGEVLYLEVSGIDSIDYYSDNYALPLDDFLPLYTYMSETDENGDIHPVSEAYMTVHMRTQCPINIYAEGEPISLSSPAIFEGSTIIAPLSEIAEAIGITDCTYFPRYKSIRVEAGDHIMYVNENATYYTMYDNTYYFDVPVQNINSLTYAQLRPFVEAFGSTLYFEDHGDYCDIYLTKSPKALESIAYQESRINQSGLSSKTDYLIWVNKEKFRLSVFEGYKGNWKHIKDFTVGIGASNSETITGVFEYTYPVSMWPYTSYYVGPVMVFHGNYAIHSTFLNYDGTPYDNTVGAKVSHGCVRCQAKYINWLRDYIPVGTRIYITEN